VNLLINSRDRIVRNIDNECSGRELDTLESR
jgi:hypothetical protein